MWLFDVHLHVTDPLLANVARADEPQDLDVVGHLAATSLINTAPAANRGPGELPPAPSRPHDAERRGAPGEQDHFLRSSDGGEDNRCLAPAAASPQLREVAPRSTEPVPSGRLPNNALTIRQLPGPSSPISTPKFLRSPRASKISVAVETVTSRSFVGGVGAPAIRRLIT